MRASGWGPPTCKQVGLSIMPFENVCIPSEDGIDRSLGSLGEYDSMAVV